MPERVLVTGSCGFVGPYLIEELLEKGYEVRAVDLPDADHSHVEKLDCEIAKADLLCVEDALEIMKGVDAIIHTAARMNYYMTRPEFELANYHLTVAVCEAALRSGARKFVHFSTCDTYGPPHYTPVDENHPQKPINLYAKTKLMGEQAAFRYHKNFGLPLTVIRPTTIYGPRCVYVMGLFLVLPVLLREKGLRKVPVPRNGFTANLVHARDVAGAAVFLMEKDEAIGEAYNISDDSKMESGELIEILLAAVGIESRRVLPVPNSLVATAARVGSHLPRAFFFRITDLLQRRWDEVVLRHQLVPALKPRFDPGFMSFGRGNYDFDNAKIKRLGYKLRYPDFKSGWNEMVRWYMENEWIPKYESLPLN